MKAGQVVPRKRTRGLRAKAWWVMRAQRHWTLESLLSIVADGRERDAASNLRKYLNPLARAGVIARDGREAPTSLTSNGAWRYRLVRDLGPHAPVVRASELTVYDPNSDSAWSYADSEDTDHD